MISEFLSLSLTINEINEVVASKSGRDPETKRKEDDTPDKAIESTETPRKDSLKLHKFHGVLGDWVNYFTPDQTRRLDDIIRHKFESQRLNLTCDASTAVKRIQKYGRILDDHPKEECTRARMFQFLLNGNASSSTSLADSESTAMLKPVLTKDEAVFVRKKEKVFILEEQQHRGGLHQARGCWHRLWLALSWCCMANVPHKRYQQLK